MLTFHLDQGLTILESIPFCDDNRDNYNMNSVDAIIACLRSVNFWSFDGIRLSGIRNDFKTQHHFKERFALVRYEMLNLKSFSERAYQDPRFAFVKYEL